MVVVAVGWVVVVGGGAGGEKREGTSFHSALHPHSWQPTTVRRWAVAVAPRAHGRSMRSASSSPSRAVAVIAEQLWEARAAAARELGSAERVDSGAPCGAACVPVRTWAPAPDPPTGAAHRRHPQRSERWMYRSAGPNWRIQVNSSEYMYLSGKRCNTILKFRTSGTRYSSRRLRVPLVRKHSQFSSLSSVTLFWRQKLN